LSFYQVGVGGARYLDSGTLRAPLHTQHFPCKPSFQVLSQLNSGISGGKNDDIRYRPEVSLLYVHAILEISGMFRLGKYA